MSEDENDNQDATGVDRRTKRALGEYMQVLPEFGRAEGADGLFIVVGENGGGECLLDTQTTTCECDDDKYNLAADEPCKHVRRARMTAGETAVPSHALSDG